MDKLEDVRRRERENLKMMEEQREKAYQAYRLHHLLSTKQVCPEKKNRSRNEIIVNIYILQMFYCYVHVCMHLSFQCVTRVSYCTT